MSEMPERIWASRSPSVGTRDWWTTEKHLGWQAEYVRADRVSMTPGEVADTRPLFVKALPGWDWNSCSHDPLFAHPFKQIVGPAIRRLLDIVAAKDAEIERLKKALDQATEFHGIECYNPDGVDRDEEKRL